MLDRSGGRGKDRDEISVDSGERCRGQRYGRHLGLRDIPADRPGRDPRRPRANQILRGTPGNRACLFRALLDRPRYPRYPQDWGIRDPSPARSVCVYIGSKDRWSRMEAIERKITPLRDELADRQRRRAFGVTVQISVQSRPRGALQAIRYGRGGYERGHPAISFTGSRAASRG